MVELRKNRSKHKLERGEIVTVAAGENTADIVDLLGPFGFDAAWIEAEHGPNDFADIPAITRACDLWGTTSLVRVNQNVPGVIYRTLDSGAQGIVVPHVNTAEEARAVVDAAMFAPIGARGMNASRQGHGVQDYYMTANDEILIVAIVEDIVAIENLDEILAVDHVDVFFVAPGDLAQSMGYIGQLDHPELVATVDSAIERITKAGRVAGAVVDDETAESQIEKGARFLLSEWTKWVETGAKRFVQKAAAGSG